MVPKHQLLGKDFLAISDFSKAEIDYFYRKRLASKNYKNKVLPFTVFKGKSFGNDF